MGTSPAYAGCTFRLGSNEAYEEYVTDQLKAFNRAKRSPLWSNPPEARAPLEIYAQDARGAIVGGLVARTNEIPEWLEVTIVWVADNRRKQGLGRQLMALAEEEAKKRGCRFARLGTGHYQAPEFYRKLGYRVYGELHDCPRGDTVYDMYKELT